jgi:hypothetical protein
LPSTPDAAERWLADEQAQAETEAEAAPAPEPDPGPMPEPAAGLPRTPDAAGHWLGRRDLGTPSRPPPSPPEYTLCSPLEPYHERVCIEQPAGTQPSGPVRCMPGEGPAEDSCRILTASEFDDPDDGVVWCHPAQGPYIGTRPCSPGEAPPPQPPAFEQGPPASTDYESWLDADRRERERQERYGDAMPTAREWETGDFQEREQGRLRFDLFIPAEEAEVLWVGSRGDDQGFDSQASPYHARAYLEVDFENDRAFVVANPTCHSDGDQCNDAKHIGDGALGDYSSEVELDNPDDGSIYIEYELSNARLPGWLIGFQGPSIDGHITVTPNEDDTSRSTGSRTPSRRPRPTSTTAVEARGRSCRTGRRAARSTSIPCRPTGTSPSTSSPTATPLVEGYSLRAWATARRSARLRRSTRCARRLQLSALARCAAPRRFARAASCRASLSSVPACSRLARAARSCWA